MQTTVNIKLVLDHKPLPRCIRYTSKAPTKRWLVTGDRVQYKRTNDKQVRGFIDTASRDCIYIFNTRTGDIVAASRTRVEERSVATARNRVEGRKS